MDYTIFQQLGAAIVLASLVGLEREQKYQRFGYGTFGGIRTFALAGLLGALSFILSAYSISFFVVITSGFLGLLISSYVMVAKKTGRMGSTSEIALILVYIVGILCSIGNFVLASAIALLTLSVLHFKKSLHDWAKHLKNEELISTVQFIVIAFVVLPLLPNQEYGPYGFFNPYLIWMMVVFISGISYLSYVAIKLLGSKRGIGITGFLGGLISSTALTLSFSAQSRKNKTIVNPYVVAVVVASSAMFFRILVEVAVLNPSLLSVLAVPMLTMGFVGGIFALFFWFKKENLPPAVIEKSVELKSPFSLWPALKFGVLFALILFFVKFGNIVMGDRGIYLTSLISSLVDVDAITVSVANLADSTITKMSAVYAITIAAIGNTIVKGCIFMFFGNRKAALRICMVFALMLLSGVASLFIFYTL